MRKLFAIAFILQIAACSHPMVSMHTTESDKNHYVILDDGVSDQYWDCHGQDAGQWAPTCRQIRMQRYEGGVWAERAYPASRSRE